MTLGKYNTTYLSKTELELRLQGYNFNPMQMHKVISAYEIAEHVHHNQVRNDGMPYFYHCSRVCKILIDELQCTDEDVLSASLLHDVLEEKSEEITKSVLEYNFGSYVTYIVETLTKDLDRSRITRDEVDLEQVEKLRTACADCLIIRLTARLDNFRCLEFNLKRNPIQYITETSERYIPLAENSSSPMLQHLVRELKKERNKFMG